MDINKLIEQAKIDTKNETHFDSFLITNGWSEDDIGFRVINKDVFLAYSYFYHDEFKVLPHAKTFASYSKIFKKNKIRMRNREKMTKLEWGLKCSEAFYNFIKQFKREHPEWQKKFKNIQNAKRSHRARKVNQKESEQLERALKMLHSKKDSSQK